MKFYNLNEYLIIIYYNNFKQEIKYVRKQELEQTIISLNKNKKVYDYVITRKVNYEY